MDKSVTLFHTPYSRSSGVLVLLQELDAEFELKIINQKEKEQLTPEYLAVNPMGKVPAVLHGDSLITEQVAIFIYLADLYAEVGLAPALNAPLRGPYLRWMVFYGSCFEPAIVDRAMKREPAPRATSPYADYETTIGAIATQLQTGPYFLGGTFTALDILWGRALTWITQFNLVEKTPLIEQYINRINTRPSVQWVEKKDAELAVTQAQEPS